MTLTSHQNCVEPKTPSQWRDPNSPDLKVHNCPYIHTRPQHHYTHPTPALPCLVRSSPPQPTQGICDRKEGECECFDGYEGHSCQRASCPEGCSGHGTCEHIETLAGDVVYALWDTGMTMGCKCDPGYTGPDCSGKACKYGIDPLYVDDDATARVSEQHYSIGGGNNTRYPLDVVSGTYAIKFYDVFGEDYLTQPIKINTDSIISGEGCNDVVAALEGLPNTVIPKSSVICSASQIYKTYDETSAQTYSLTFTGNPGYLKPLTIDTYLDGDRETVTPTDAKGETTVTTFNRGVSGEFVDYFASKCEGVTVQLVVDYSFFVDCKLWDSSTTSATYDTYYSYDTEATTLTWETVAVTKKRC